MDHHFALEGVVTELDGQTADTFQKMGIVEILPTPVKEQKENALARGKSENAAV